MKLKDPFKHDTGSFFQMGISIVCTIEIYEVMRSTTAYIIIGLNAIL
jgi:hypothetical protein